MWWLDVSCGAYWSETSCEHTESKESGSSRTAVRINHLAWPQISMKHWGAWKRHGQLYGAP